MEPIRKMWDTPRPSRPAAPSSAPKWEGWKSRLPVMVLAVLFLAAAGSSAFFYHELLAARQVALPGSASAADDAQVAALVSQVEKLMVLPEGETPTIATVSDPEKLKDQAFFAHAKAGDKVLIYAQAKKAILYSPAENRIVEVAAIDLGATPAAAPQPAKPQPTK